MNRRPKSSIAPARLSQMRMLLVALAGLAIGAGLMWLLTRGTPPASVPDVENGNSVKARAGVPPDVSLLAPGDAATTLANWNYDRQNWAHAIEHYQQALALGRDIPDVRTDLGNCFRFLGEGQKALAQYETAQRQNPQHENSLLNQAGLFAEVLHDPVRAQAAAREFIARFPQSPAAASARKYLGQAEGGTKDQEQSIREWLDQKPGR